jgi:outer membrane lipoprotein-sorting protein
MRKFLLLSMLAVAGAGAQAQGAKDARLTKVLAQMDAASAKFVSAQAQFSWDQLTAVVQEHDVQKGTIAFRRAAKGGTMMVVHVMTEDGQPAPKEVLYKNGVLDLYQPSIKQETVLPSGAKQGEFESYATLGFGGSGKDLAAQWNVTYQGADTIDGTAVAKLGLAPMHPEANQMFSKIDIWIDPATATSLKQVFYTPGGDTRTALYSDIRLNATPESAFAIKIPGGTNVVPK